MKTPDLDRLRSEAVHSLAEFKKLYNEDLPESFNRVSVSLLQEYQAKHLDQFKSGDVWSLGLHRKRVMDWLRTHPAFTLQNVTTLHGKYARS